MYMKNLQESSMIKMVFIIDACRPHIEIIRRVEIETEKHELVYFLSGSLQETFLFCLLGKQNYFKNFLGNASFLLVTASHFLNLQYCIVLVCTCMFFLFRKFLRKQPSSLQVMMLFRKRTISKVLLNRSFRVT